MKNLFGVFVFGLSLTFSLAARPNVILVFIDDMGWGDFSCFGNEAAQTPEVDRMAKEGVRFEQILRQLPDLLTLADGDLDWSISAEVEDYILSEQP